MFTRVFLTAAAERMVKTFCQILGASLVAAGTGLIDTDWVGILSMVGMATLLSLLTSIGSSELAPGPGPAAFGPETIPDDSHEMRDDNAARIVD